MDYKHKKRISALTSKRMKPIIYLLLVCMILLILQQPIQLMAQLSGSYYLQRGIKKYEENWDIIGAISDLQMAIQKKDLKTKEEQIQICKYLAYCYAENGDQYNAEKTFNVLLKIYPKFRLPKNSSPTYYIPFTNALKGSDKEAPIITVITERKTSEGEPYIIRVIVKDNTRVDKVTVAYKIVDDSMSNEEMEYRGDDTYELIIPNVKKPSVLYNVTAWDIAENISDSGDIEVEVKGKSNLWKWLLGTGITLLIGGYLLYNYVIPGTVVIEVEQP